MTYININIKVFLINFLIHLLLIAFVIPLFGNNNPHKVHIKKGNKEIFYFGSVHSNDYKNHMFKDILSNFIQFNPEIVLVEGGANKISYQNEMEAIKNGEMAFVSYLAKKMNIKSLDIEPSGRYIDSILSINFSKEQILSMYALRQTYQYINSSKHNKIVYKKTITNYINLINQQYIKIDYTELDFKTIFEMVLKETGISITEDNWNQQIKIIRRHLKQNKIYAKTIEIRDEYAIDKIISILKNYNRVFIIMGNQHLYNQEVLLRNKILEEYN